MKRANESETSESKKTRSLADGRGNSEQVDNINNNGNMFVRPQHPSLDLNLWNFEVNEEQQNRNCVGFDLNVPFCQSSELIDHLSLGLGMSETINEDMALPLMGTEREERNGLCLSLNADVPNDFDNIRQPVTTIDLEVLERRKPPPGLVILSEVAVMELRKEEAETEQRLNADRAMQIENARRLREQYIENQARLHREDRLASARKFVKALNHEIASSLKKEALPTSSSMQQLGKLPGLFCEALNKVRGRIPKGGAHKLIEWKSSEKNQDKGIIRRAVPSLMDLSLKTLLENVERIVSLELVPDNLRKRLTNMMCDMHKINTDFLRLLIKGCPTEVCIKNCSWISESQFEEIFENLETKELRVTVLFLIFFVLNEVLQLDLCGQFRIDLALQKNKLQSPKGFSNLSNVSLRGAFHLTDDGVKDLVTSAPVLQSLNLGQCCLLTSDAINCIADSLGTNLRELYIDECLKIDPILILPAFEKFKCLEVISVANIPSITDQFVREMIALCGEHLRELDLAICPELTDRSLEIIGSKCASLCCLNVSNLHNMTDLGLEHLANGCILIKKLRFCHNRFSDEAMAAFLESSGENLTELSLNHMTMAGPNTAFSIAKCAKKLISLDISWCRKITNNALGLIVDSCSALKQLRLFGCRQITDEFFKGHSNPLVQIIGQDKALLLSHLNLD